MTHHDTSARGLTRPVFFDRQNLSAQDLNCLVDYIRAERRRHNRHVIGWGVTTGLAVTASTTDPWEVLVGPGHAIAPSGTEMEVLPGAAPFDICAAARLCLDLPEACEDPLDVRPRNPEIGPGGDNAFEPPRGDRPANPGIPDILAATPAANGQGISVDFSGLSVNQSFANPLDLPIGTLTTRFTDGRLIDRIPVLSLASHVGLLALMQTQLVFDREVQEVRITLVHATNAPVVSILDPGGEVLDQQAPTDQRFTPQTLVFQGERIAELRLTHPGRDVVIQRIEVARINRPVGTVYLALCPDDKPACFKPGVPEHCMPPGDNIHPARILEGTKLEVLCQLPGTPDMPSCETVRTWVCEDQHVPVPSYDADCVVIAAIEVGAQGIVSIDAFGPRRRLPPAWVVAAQGACCCCDDTPRPTPTPTPTPSPTPSPTPTPSISPSIFETGRPSVFVTGRPTIFETVFPSFFETIAPSFFETLQPSFFETGRPSFFASSFTETISPSLIVNPVATGIIVTPGGLEFDPVRGRVLGLDDLTGIGAPGRTALLELDVTNVTEFIEMDSVRLSEALGLSEVRIAALQEEARGKTLETTPVFDPERGSTLRVTELTGVGLARARKLADIGVTTFTGLIETDRRTLAEALGLPMETVLQLQKTARARTLEGPG